jgi:hypothetical protein
MGGAIERGEARPKTERLIGAGRRKSQFPAAIPTQMRKKVSSQENPGRADVKGPQGRGGGCRVQLIAAVPSGRDTGAIRLRGRLKDWLENQRE